MSYWNKLRKSFFFKCKILYLLVPFFIPSWCMGGCPERRSIVIVVKKNHGQIDTWDVKITPFILTQSLRREKNEVVHNLSIETWNQTRKLLYYLISQFFEKREKRFNDKFLTNIFPHFFPVSVNRQLCYPESGSEIFRVFAKTMVLGMIRNCVFFAQQNIYPRNFPGI